MDGYWKERMREDVLVCVQDGDEVDALDWLRKLEVWLHTARSVRLTCWLDASPHLFMIQGLMEGWIMGDLDRPFGCRVLHCTPSCELKWSCGHLQSCSIVIKL